MSTSVFVRVLKCTNLKTSGFTKVDPYVEVRCGELQGKTVVLSNATTQFVFNEVFKFPLDAGENCKPIILRAFNKSKLGKDTKIGEATLHLKSLERPLPLTSGPLQVNLCLHEKGVTGMIHVEIQIPSPGSTEAPSGPALTTAPSAVHVVQPELPAEDTQEATASEEPAAPAAPAPAPAPAAEPVKPPEPAKAPEPEPVVKKVESTPAVEKKEVAAPVKASAPAPPAEEEKKGGGFIKAVFKLAVMSAAGYGVQKGVKKYQETH